MQGRNANAISGSDQGSYRACGSAAMKWHRARNAAFADPSEENVRAADAAWQEAKSARDAWLASQEEVTW